MDTQVDNPIPSDTRAFTLTSPGAGVPPTSHSGTAGRRKAPRGSGDPQGAGDSHAARSGQRLRFPAGVGETLDPGELVAQLAFRSSVLEAQAEAVDEGLLLVSPSGEIISYNRRFAEQWGFDEALLRSHSDDDAIAEAVNQLVDPDGFVTRIRYLYDHPDERSTDELRFRDGRVLERFSAPVRADDGAYYGRVWSFRDITQQRRTEASLAKRATEQAALYRFTDRLHHAASLDDVYEAAIESILSALGCDRASLLLFDDEGVMRFVAWRGLSDEYRRAVEGHTPWRPDEADARPISVDDIVDSDLDDALKRTVLAEGIHAFAFIPLVTAERLIGKFMVYFDAPHAFVADELTLALTIARQIAFGIGRRRSDEERERAEGALREADRRKDEFLATLAHELRNPLASMRNALPLLETRLEHGEDVSRLVEIVSRQTERLGRLVDDLMDVSRITRGYVDLRREVIDLVPLVSRAIEATTEQPEANERELDVTLPRRPLPVLGDPVRLEQVVHNLLANAFKYTEPGGHVSVKLRRAREAVELTVADDGVGIDGPFVDHVFDLFQQADRSLDRSQGGLGIGLTVARQLVELHGGSIEAHSAGSGAGSQFVVRLPIAPPQAGTGVQAADRGVTAPAGDGVRRRVLIVDDSRDQTDVLAELVEQLGHEAAVAHDGLEAVRLVSDVRPDIVLLDIGLPGLSGYDIAETLRRDPANAGMLLIAVTGYGQPSDRKRSAEAGFDAHVVKPIEVELLGTMLDTGSAPRAGDAYTSSA